jgi:hypothetical protein
MFSLRCFVPQHDKKYFSPDDQTVPLLKIVNRKQ